MPKIKSTKDCKHWVLSQHDPDCCWSHITAFHSKDEDSWIDNEIFVGVLGWSNENYYKGWKGKIRAIWSIIRGKHINHSHWFNDRESAEQFRDDFNEAIDFAFDNKESIRYGGSYFCQHCHKMVNTPHECPNNPVHMV